jgi:subtilisin family serine protease
MPTRRPLVPALLATALTLAGCLGEQGPTAPEPTAPHLSLSASETAASQQLVTFRGKGIPASFEADVARLGGTILYRHEGAGLALVSGVDASRASVLGAIKGVAQVQANDVLQLETARSAPRALGEFNVQSQADPAAAILAGWQWNLTAIHADEAWASGRLGSPEVTVAILDTGIDYDGRDLNGLVDLSRSASFVPSDDALTAAYFPTRHPISDYNGHGTNVAQQVSSKAFAFAGVTSRTTLIGVKVLGANGSGSIGGILFGMLWAADHGADVINLSLGGFRQKAGGGGQLQAIINSVLGYVNRSGTLIVAAAGNESADLDRNLVPHPLTGEIIHAPSLEYDYCTASHVLCVSSVGPTTGDGSPDVPAIYTNFGHSAVDVAGPGGNIGSEETLWPWGLDQASWVFSLCSKTALAFDDEGNVLGLSCPSGLGIWGFIGTSQATPHVSGLAALLIAENGRGKPSQLKAAIRNSAVRIGQGGNDVYSGKGRIDVARALGLN